MPRKSRLPRFRAGRYVVRPNQVVDRIDQSPCLFVRCRKSSALRDGGMNALLRWISVNSPVNMWRSARDRGFPCHFRDWLDSRICRDLLARLTFIGKRDRTRSITKSPTLATVHFGNPFESTRRRSSDPAPPSTRDERRSCQQADGDPGNQQPPCHDRNTPPRLHPFEPGILEGRGVDFLIRRQKALQRQPMVDFPNALCLAGTRQLDVAAAGFLEIC